MDREAPSPLLIYDLPWIEERLKRFRMLVEGSPIDLLYSIKAQPFSGLLAFIASRVDGFSVSSIFEARLVCEVLEQMGLQEKTVQLTSPALSPRDMERLGSSCTHMTFNSLDQLQRCMGQLPPTCQIGLRINHGISSIEDERYNPCRKGSKLGVPLEDLRLFAAEKPEDFSQIKGLHFHSHFRSSDPLILEKELMHIQRTLGQLLSGIEWLNLGGGYVLRDTDDVLAFRAVVNNFCRVFGGRLVIEPGFGLVGEAGRLHATIIDLFERDRTQIAVLDTGVHHLPEVFEYQKTPAVLEASPEGPFEALLAGGSCLAGDLFGRYTFHQPLQIGAPITFLNVGAYSLVKASRFNGHDLPAIGFKDDKNQIRVLKTFGFEAFRQYWSPSHGHSIEEMSECIRID